MGFLDKAKAAANDLAAKADTALSGAGMAAPGGGDAERYFRDLGVLAYLEWSGRPSPAGDRERIMAVLREMDARGAIRSYALHTAPPPAPGAPAAAPPPGAGTAPGTVPSAPPGPAESRAEGGGPAATPQPPTPQPPSAPPPPPSWMQGGGTA